MDRDFKGIWIPKEVWLTRDLSIQEKVFLVEIDSLDGNNGCYASNEYFSEFFGLSKNRCSEIIKSLERKSKITISYKYKEGTNSIERRILRVKKGIRETDRGIRETDRGVRETDRGCSEKCEENNTIYNNTNINIYSANDAQDIWELYPNKKGKAQAMKKIPKLLETLGKDVLAECVKKYSAEVKGKDKQFILNGSTFFNGRYEDYLDDAIEAGSKANDNIDNNEVNENKYIFKLSEDM